MSTANDDDGPSFFARYIDDPEKERPRPEIIRLSRDTEKLLDWLVNHWTKPTITVREIRIYGPNAIRDGKTAVSTAEILVEQGWLIPLKAHRRDRREWQIVPKTNASLFLKLIQQQQQL